MTAVDLELAHRVPAGRPDGGQFAEPSRAFTRHATPAEMAAAVNELGRDQRARARVSALPPAGYERGRDDTLREAQAAACGS